MGTLEEARKIFSKDLYATELSGIEIDDIGKDYAKCSMKLTEKHKNAYGGIMGGAIYTLADFAFAVASNYEKEQARKQEIIEQGDTAEYYLETGEIYENGPFK